MNSNKKFRVKREEDNPDEWLLTYSDAVTLVLCFFIILFSVSKPQEDQFKKISDAFKAAGFTTPEAEIESNPMSELKQDIQEMIEHNALEKVMSVEETENGIDLELSSSAFYHSGSAKFRKEAIPILENVVNLLHDFDYDAYEFHVHGHTDDAPIKSPIFPSNWELSAGRSANIVRFFIADGLSPELMQAIGHAETQPKVPHRDAEGNPIIANREQNRRIVVRIQRVD